MSKKKKKIHRFPRLWEDYPMAIPHLQHLSVNRRAKAVLQMGLQSKRWSKLTKRQKKLVRKIVNGTPINEALKKYGVSQNTYYRWLNGHKLFQKYFRAQALKAAEMVETRLDGSLGRAVRVVEDAMGSRDPYFAYGAAKDFLTGRGKYRRSTDVKKDVSGTVSIHKDVEVNKHMDADMMRLFIEALAGKARGDSKLIEKPKVIDVEVLNQLPAPIGSANEVQEHVKAKAS